MRDFQTPLSDEDIGQLHVGDMIMLSGYIYTGRDAVLPKLVRMIEDGSIEDTGLCLQGGVIFHTAVSPAGVGPTSSNKAEIEGSFSGLSRGGIKLHLGKGKISEETVRILQRYNAVYAVIPPVTALLADRTKEQRVVAFPEEGMEAMHQLKVERYPCIIAAVNGQSIYDKGQ
ncbi:MAG: fumarate hydratase C-terminal domain-containing protein [Oscillospiraceae bacterium]|nr:fumarate hydratase C-terminal domain-containing protein [Oscillospiraceae bacterium]